MSELQERWERVAASLPAGTADGIEQNAADLHEPDSDAYFAECLGQAEGEME